MKFIGYSESSFQYEMQRENTPVSVHLDSVAEELGGR